MLPYKIEQADTRPDNTPKDDVKKADNFVLVVSICFIALLFLGARLFFAPPLSGSTTSTRIVEIMPGETTAAVGTRLYNQSFIKSPFLFKVLVRAFSPTRGVIAGRYKIENGTGLLSVAKILTSRDLGGGLVKVTFPEGTNISEMADLLDGRILNFDKKKFEDMAKAKEGYLFPDTYFFSSVASPDNVIAAMEENFENKMESVKNDIVASGHSGEDVLIMASILEEEGKTTESRKVISGILWKRLSAGMALQVDATLGYVLGKGSLNLTVDDLKMKSPYNTYVKRGLPPSPISNPGMDSIMAAIYPTKSPYVYYLSDKDGNIYYAKTFEEHKQNKAQYLK
ncbi:MAG: endolytic transglycosylase MltG [Candidatus Paceibacterota bacterium]|jgi:UPF0755 protein